MRLVAVAAAVAVIERAVIERAAIERAVEGAVPSERGARAIQGPRGCLRRRHGAVRHAVRSVRHLHICRPREACLPFRESRLQRF